MPEIVRFYSGEDAILPNVETYRCREPDALAYVLDRLPELVVKLVDGSGGYGMLVGPTATAAEIEAFRAHIIASPERFIAQPTLALSTCPTLTAKGLAPRHVDLRPRSEEHTPELQSLMRISYAVFCLKKKKTINTTHYTTQH